jgi:hypothetical protein
MSEIWILDDHDAFLLYHSSKFNKLNRRNYEIVHETDYCILVLPWDGVFTVKEYSCAGGSTDDSGRD